jgi:poly(3-hydroxybutyrate) depolymerase
MKHLSLIIFVLFSISSFAQNGLTKIDDFGENKGNLKMFTYIPKNLKIENPIPIVFVLHGCTQTAEEIANETGWNKLADSLNFMIVYPEQRQINNAAKCFNFYIGFKAKKDKGEVASIKDMIDYCYKNYYIDSTQVFITGMSAGGGMSNAVLNAYPELFNAGALVAAPDNLFNPNKNEYQPRIAILQGDDDKIVVPKNAIKLKEQWLKKHQLEITNLELKMNYLNNPLLTAEYFYNIKKEVKIITIFAEGIRHKLLIKPGDKISEGGTMDNHTQDVNFHSTYWIAQFFGLTMQ